MFPEERNPFKKLINKFTSRAMNDPFYAVIAYRNYRRVDE